LFSPWEIYICNSNVTSKLKSGKRLETRQSGKESMLLLSPQNGIDKDRNPQVSVTQVYPKSPDLRKSFTDSSAVLYVHVILQEICSQIYCTRRNKEDLFIVYCLLVIIS